jgi:hypothetical protein
MRFLFYKDLLFNYHQSIAAQANMVRSSDPVFAYPPLIELLRPGTSVIDIGCGAGWREASNCVIRT